MTDQNLELDRLVRSARSVDQPSRRDLDRNWERLSAGVLTGAAVTTVTPSAGAAAATGAGSSATAVFGAAMWKWGAGVAILGLCAAGTVVGLRAGSTPRSAPLAAPSRTVPAVTPPAGDAIHPDDPDVARTDSPLGGESKTDSQASAQARRPLPADSLAREVALVRAAKVAADQGRAAQALALLDRYDREFPSGTLQNEARATRAHAYCSAGNTAAARAEISRLDPNSALARGLESGCRSR